MIIPAHSASLRADSSQARVLKFIIHPIIPIVIKFCAFVISTGRLRSCLKWRDLAANDEQV